MKMVGLKGAVVPVPRSPNSARAPAGARVASPTYPELFQAMMVDAESGVLLLDGDARVVEINARAQQLLGVSAGRARGRPGTDLVRTAVPGDSPIADGFRSRRTEREVILVGPRGAEVPAWIKTTRLGSPPWLLVTLRDLTQVRRMREELRRNERLAVLGQLAAGVAHEIRNPLAGIGTSAQVLLRRFEPRDERSRFVSVILEEVARLDRIVTGLLQYSRPRTPELAPVELAELARHVVGLLRESLETSGVRAEVAAAPRLGAVFVDSDLVTQVLLNVSLNAIQAMPNGGELRFELRRVRRRQPPRAPGRRSTDPAAAPDRRVAGPWNEYQQIRVIDTGAGISRGVLAKLFNPFFTTKPSGTGLGLAICQTIMQEHRGSIEVASREGHGTSVILNFPVEKRHGERREPDPHAVGADVAGR